MNRCFRSRRKHKANRFETGSIPYRSRRGLIFGVSRGFAEYSGIHVFWIRLAWIISTLMTGFMPMPLIYIVMAIFMKAEPANLPQNEDEAEFYNSYADNRRMALDRLKRKFDGLERRARRLENIVTDKEFDWDRRFGESSRPAK